MGCQAMVQSMLRTQPQELVRKGRKLEKCGMKAGKPDLSQVLAPKHSINKTHRLKLGSSLNLHLEYLTQRVMVRHLKAKQAT